MSNDETRLQYAIQEALCWIPGVEAWALTTARRGKLAFGLRELGGNVSGGADIIGCVDGLLLWCEVKLPGKDVEAGSDQERRLEIARKLGAIAIVAHSVDEAVGFVQRRQRQLRSDRQLLHLLKLACGSEPSAAEAMVDWQAKAVQELARHHAEGWDGGYEEPLEGFADDINGIKRALMPVCPECERPMGHAGDCGMEEPGDYP